MSGDDLWNLIDGLDTNDLLQYTHLLTGYMASVSFLETIARVVKRLRTANPDLIYGNHGLQASGSPGANFSQ